MIALLVLWACGSPTPAPTLAAPDVVVVTVDTLRADRLGFMGHAAARTPNLDALAARGFVFTSATTPMPRTTPALASLQTGLWPVHHGAREVGDELIATRTLAGLLAEAGWATAAVSAISVASPAQHLDRGFQRFEVHHDAPAADITAAALGLLDPAKPTYLWVHYADPHFPYLPTGSGGGPCRALGQQAASGKLQRQALFANRDGKASEVLDDCKALYDGEIAGVDAAIGDLLEGLRAKGRPDPLIVFSADHGENQGEDGLFFEHGPSVHDAGLHIPMVVAGAGVPVGRDGGVARLEDVAPTVLDWLDLAIPTDPPMDGASLEPRLRGLGGGPTLALAESGSALQLGLHLFLVSGKSERWCVNGERYAWCHLPKGDGLYDHVADPDLKRPLTGTLPEVEARLKAAAERWPAESARSVVARDGRFKLVGRPSLDGGYAWALYDLAADPAESRDVAAEQPAVAEAMRAALEGWADRPLPRAEARSEAELEPLRALGYVE